MHISNLIVAFSLVLWSVSAAAQDGSGDGPADAAPAAAQEGSGEAPAASDEAAPEDGSSDVSAEEAEASESAAETLDESASADGAQLPEGVDAGVQVVGMVCQFCASGIERLMGREDRIETFEVSFDDSIVYVTFAEDETMSEQQLARLIRRAGYECTGVVWN